MFLVALLMVGCGDKGTVQPTPTSSPTTVASPTGGGAPGTATASATPTPYAASFRTGNAAVDHVLDTLGSHDVATARELVGLVDVACTTADGGVGTLRCPSGERDGTTHAVFALGSCQPSFVGEQDARRAVGDLAAKPLKLYAAYYALGHHVGVVLGDGTADGWATLDLDSAGRVVGMSSCGDGLAGISAQHLDVIAPPL
jgi:hypothetical protein